MSAPLDLNSAVIRNHLNCASIDCIDGKMTIIFRSQESAEIFNKMFKSAWKTDQILSSHCGPFIPEGFKSWKDYARMIGTPCFSTYAVKIDDDFTVSTLVLKLLSLNQ